MIIIFFICLSIICFIILLYYLFKFKVNAPQQIYVEQFTSKKQYNDLIINGNFENGKDSPNHINQSGYNKIILKKNPSNSSYVLEQKKTNNLTYYELVCKNEKNSKYNLYFWLSTQSINELDFEKLIKIKIQNEDLTNYTPRLNYNIIQKVVLSDTDNDTWYLLKYNFNSDNNTSPKMSIYLNYSDNLQNDFYYFTNIGVYRVLIDAENFIYNNSLLSYIDGYHYESNNETWHDLSGKGNDLFWSNIPTVDYTKGQINTIPNKLTGFPAEKLSNENFTILFCLNKNIGTDSDNGSEDNYLISVPGNDRYSFEIKIHNNYLILLNGNEEYKTKNEVILFNKSLLTIIYDGSILYIIHDGYEILKQKVKKMYFSKDNLIINKNRNIDYSFYSILFYNRIIDNDELKQIREYFITNQNKNFNTPDINIHHMNNTANYTTNADDISLFKPYDKKIIIDNFNNFDNINNCAKDCNDFCNEEEADSQCINTCNTNVMSCKNLCDDAINKNSIYCNGATPLYDSSKRDDTSGTTSSGTNTSGTTPSGTTPLPSTCPTVYKKDGKYIVYIPSTSTYVVKGEKSYGTNLNRARYMYNINFPECPTPKELIQGSVNTYTETCPYVINELNPCYTSVCANVNWNVENYKDLNLDKNCKKVVSNYCHINNAIDEKCYCWNPKNKNNEECIEMRKYFEDATDYCEPQQFKIEDHPDFNKYIKKDSVPCWGCNLSN